MPLPQGKSSTTKRQTRSVSILTSALVKITQKEQLKEEKEKRKIKKS